MANYNTGTTGTLTAQPHGTAFTLTVPAGVATGDVMFAAIEVFTQNGSSNSFGTPTSGGGSWTQVSSTLTATYTGGGTFPCYGMVWYRIATASDPSSTFSISYTGTTPSPDQLWWAVCFESYTGFYTANPIGNVATFTNGNSTTITAPSSTTSTANSWEVDTCQVACASSGTILSTPLTNRHTVSTQGINSGFSDSNASVGAAGTAIGGNNWTTTSAVNNSGMAFTIELRTQAPAGATSGTVQPRATVPVPRRKPGRAVWAQIAGQGFVFVPAPVQQYRLAPRRKLARAYVQFIPVTTTNAAAVQGPAGTVPVLMANQTRVVVRRDGRVVRR